MSFGSYGSIPKSRSLSVDIPSPSGSSIVWPSLKVTMQIKKRGNRHEDRKRRNHIEAELSFAGVCVCVSDFIHKVKFFGFVDSEILSFLISRLLIY